MVIIFEAIWIYVQASNQNPNYFTQQIDFGHDESRLIAGLKLNHQFNDDLSFNFIQSIDKRNLKAYSIILMDLKLQLQLLL